MHRRHHNLGASKVPALRIVAGSVKGGVPDVVQERIDRIIADRLGGKKTPAPEVRTRLTRLFERVAEKIPTGLSEEEIEERAVQRYGRLDASSGLQQRAGDERPDHGA